MWEGGIVVRGNGERQAVLRAWEVGGRVDCEGVA